MSIMCPLCRTICDINDESPVWDRLEQMEAECALGRKVVEEREALRCGKAHMEGWVQMHRNRALTRFSEDGERMSKVATDYAGETADRVQVLVDKMGSILADADRLAGGDREDG